MKRFLVIFVLLLFPSFAHAFGSVNPAAINQYKYYQTTPCWNRGMKMQKPCIYSEQQARYYGYRTQGNSVYNQSNSRTYGNYSSNYGSTTRY